eukprot:TRINITY_DN2589_c0_g1_i1.p1 TRINITY_DN2589_c0_g1~~TRINITY_DN2589_c0_g1_i1.p1  ORF type:complete len:378 (+),score=25.82 TRINITY_DN2589_c0_g1_i1:101-1135(+)
MESVSKVSSTAASIATLQTRILSTALESIKKEHPNFLDLPIPKPAVYNGHPSHLHPAFFGSFDWHSSVHSHWTISRLLKLDPSLPFAEDAFKMLRAHLTSDNIEKEIEAGDYLIDWELPYGFAWLLVLAANLRTWDCDSGKCCTGALMKLEDNLKGLFYKWMEVLPTPERVGQHDNTSFALILLHIYAKAVGDAKFASKVSETAHKFFENDVEFTDPDPGECFLSPSLCVIHLMSLVKSEPEFHKWLKQRKWQPVLELNPVEGDAKDPYKSHLIGLNFSRCWSMNHLAKLIPEAAEKFKEKAKIHFEASLDLVPSGHWESDHWTATYALMAYLSFQEGDKTELY